MYCTLKIKASLNNCIFKSKSNILGWSPRDCCIRRTHKYWRISNTEKVNNPKSNLKFYQNLIECSGQGTALVLKVSTLGREATQLFWLIWSVANALKFLDTSSSIRKDVANACRSATKNGNIKKKKSWDKMFKHVYGKTYPFLSDVMEKSFLVCPCQGCLKNWIMWQFEINSKPANQNRLLLREGQLEFLNK